MKRIKHLLSLLLALLLLASVAAPGLAAEGAGNGVTTPPQWTSTETYDWYKAVEVQTERATGKAPTTLYTFEVKANVAKLTVANDGVRELDVAVNGQRFNLNAFFDQGKGTASFDISSFVTYGANSLEVLSLGKPGETATITVEVPAFSARLLHTNDMHAKIDPLPKMSAYVKAAKAAGGYVYFVNAGDIFSGNPVSDLNKGVPMIEALNAMSTDLLAVGNHDFDHGPAATQARRSESAFPWLSANTVVADPSATPIQPFAPHQIYTTELGQKIAFIGLTETPPSTGKKNIVGLQFTSPVAAVQQQINALRSQVNVIVVVSHQGHNVDVAMAQQITGADLILGAHSHTYLSAPVVINGIPIIQVGSDSRYLSDLVVRQTTGISIAGAAPGGKHTVEVAKLTAADPVVKEIVDRWNAEMAPVLDAVIGYTLTELDRNDRYTRDVSIGNLIADGIRDYMEADLGFWNNGGIRASIPAGNITMKQVYTVLPFGNFLWKVEATGAEILEMILKSYARPGRTPQIDLQISGGAYTIFTNPDGSVNRIDMKVGGQPIDLNRTYTMAVSDYVGTSSTYWAAPPTVIDIAGEVDAIAVGEYIKKLGTVNYPSSEGRIVVRPAPTPVAVTKLNFYNSSSIVAANPSGGLTALTNQATVLVSAEAGATQADRKTFSPHFVMANAGQPIPLAAFEQVGNGKVAALGTNLAANQQRHQNWQWFTNLLDFLTGTNGGTVLVDEGHNQFNDAGKYSSSKLFLADRGWNLTFTGKNTALTAAKLQGVKVLVISPPQVAYTAAEIQVVNDFLAAGGNVILASGTDYYTTNNATLLNQVAAGIGTVLRANSDEVRHATENDGVVYSPNTDEFNPAFPGLVKAR